MLTRGTRYLTPFSPRCHGVDVERSLTDATTVLTTVERLRPDRLGQFDWQLDRLSLLPWTPSVTAYGEAALWRADRPSILGDHTGVMLSRTGAEQRYALTQVQRRGCGSSSHWCAR